MVITGIKACYVKGIEKLEVECRLFPNKPNFIVGPNGVGKSSLATAFRSLNRNRLRLVEADYFSGSTDEDAMLSVSLDDGRTLVADKTRNEIRGEFDVFVINSGLYAAQIPRYANGRSVSEARISVPDAVLWERMPRKAKVAYRYGDTRGAYPEQIRKCLSNFTDLFADAGFLKRIVESSGFERGTDGKRYSEAIEDFITQMSALQGTREQMLDAPLDFSRISSVVPVKAIADWLPEYTGDQRDAARYLDAIQLKRFCEARRDGVKDAYAYLSYKAERKRVDDLLGAVNTSHLSIKTQAQGGRVFLHFPKRDQVSNGELDILQFIASLAMAAQRLNGRRAILVVDEVFDYLDDGNLLIAQYYLLRMMEQFKARGGELFAVLLTHLDPSTLSSYRFKTKHVAFIGPCGEGRVSSYMRNILTDRVNCQKNNEAVYERISTNYLHYAPNAVADEATREYLERKGVSADVIDPVDFAAEMDEDLRAYLRGGRFDAAKVCCALRVTVERYAYNLLDGADRREFLEIDKGTLQRLNFACERGVDIPEIMFLLSSVYNECMHLDAAASSEPLIIRKLSNGYIRSMIEMLANIVEAQ